MSEKTESQSGKSTWNFLMSNRFAAICGLLGPLIAFIGIAVSISLSLSWFTWFNNALSDLGHPSRPVAPIFNGGLILCGIITLPLAFRLILLQRSQKSIIGIIGGFFLLLSQFFVIGVGLFNEAFVGLHYAASVGFFVSLLLFGLIYGVTMMRIQDTRLVGILAFLLAFISAATWVAKFANLLPWTGVAIPEIISAIAIFVWVFPVCIRLYLHHD
jgi:hypothetical membrane protein